MQRDYITVVAGLPRSGTSMMMQMLQAGGIPVLSDGEREADEDNPLGYLEFEPVKQTAHDPSWLNDAAGRVVKMAHVLLLDLPLEHRYRIVFMRRPLPEVVESQNIMLRRKGIDPDTLPPKKLEAVYLKQVEEVILHTAAHPETFRWLQVGYHDVLSDPRAQAARLSEFLDGTDVDAMTAVVEPSLYRVRKATSQSLKETQT